MKERPILFSGEMVRALLDGRKTQTRRVVKMPPSWDCIVYADWGNGWWPYRSDDGESPNYDNNEIPMNCPYGQPGDRLWVRESFRNRRVDGLPGDVMYRADHSGEKTVPGSYGRSWKPSIHMPRWASRITLEIVSVRVERLQEITLGDVCKEGLAESIYEFVPVQAGFGAFQDLWDSINGPESWAANPWVWVVEFRRIEQESAAA